MFECVAFSMLPFCRNVQLNSVAWDWSTLARAVLSLKIENSEFYVGSHHKYTSVVYTIVHVMKNYLQPEQKYGHINVEPVQNLHKPSCTAGRY